MQEFDESGDPENHFQALLSLAKEGIQKGKVVAVGECGLDYDRLHFCPAEVQKKYFEKQFELAHATKLPMFLHMRAAAEDFCEIMKSNKCRQVLEVIAGCKGVDLEEMSRTIYHNTCRIFFPQDLDSAAESILAGNQDSQST
ncbi:Deoxyribonuclease TATDN1 [Linum perenne]